MSWPAKSPLCSDGQVSMWTPADKFVVSKSKIHVMAFNHIHQCKDLSCQPVWTSWAGHLAYNAPKAQPGFTRGRAALVFSPKQISAWKWDGASNAAQTHQQKWPSYTCNTGQFLGWRVNWSSREVKGEIGDYLVTKLPFFFSISLISVQAITRSKTHL